MDRNASNPTPIRENTKVALRKESVDRNENTGTDWIAMTRSLSARRAWIEIIMQTAGPKIWPDGRSPQGERG